MKSLNEHVMQQLKIWNTGLKHTGGICSHMSHTAKQLVCMQFITTPTKAQKYILTPPVFQFMCQTILPRGLQMDILWKNVGLLILS